MSDPSWKPDHTLDCRGATYPVPIYQAKEMLAGMAAGEILELLATDPGTGPDMPIWTEKEGYELLEVSESGGVHRFYIRKPATAPASQPGAAAEAEDERLFLVVLRSGLNAPGQVRAALMYASLAAAMDQNAVVYCVQQGADVMVQGAADKEEAKPGAPTIKQRLAEALEMGVRIEVCEQTALVRNIEAGELIPEAVLVGGARLIDYAIRARGSLTF
ncbi:MAG: sulfurtransferase TusA family protein [Anaerolineae bacterium]